MMQPEILSLPLPSEPRYYVAVEHILCKVSLHIYGSNPMHG
jgi:hypothetical protein